MTSPPSFCLLAQHTFPVTACLAIVQRRTEQSTHPSPSSSPRSPWKKQAAFLLPDGVIFSDKVHSLTYTIREESFHTFQTSQGVFHLTFQPLFPICLHRATTKALGQDHPQARIS